MKITRLGHAAVLVEASKTIIIDPYIKDNPAASGTVDDIPKVDYILVSHDHFDHMGEAVALAKRDNAQLIAVHEVTVSKDVTVAGVQVVGMNIGGTYEDDGVKISLTPAIHSCEAGSPCGFVIILDGKTIYHSGDTDVFSDMALIPQLHGDIDVAMVPIGGHFTMDEHGAAMAARYLKASRIIPIHYNTWPPIVADVELFIKLVGDSSEVIVLEPGQAFETE